MLTETEKYKSLQLFARQVVEGFITGLHKSPFHGFSVEFAEHRLYTNGESTRNIDWKLYARSDKLFVKQFNEETNLRCHIVIDHSSSMAFPVDGHNNLDHPNKITFAIYAAAVLCDILHKQRDAFGLSFVSDTIDLQTPTRSNAEHHRYLLQLLQQELSSSASLSKSKTLIAPSLHLIAEQLHKRSLVAIFTDALLDPQQHDDLFDALRHLRHNKHEVILFHTLDNTHELKFNYPDKPTIFVDLESGEELKVQPHEVAQQYQQQMDLLCQEIKRHALQYNIDYQPCWVDRGFDNVLLPFLLHRQKM